MFLLAGRVVAFADDVQRWVEEQAAATATGGGAA
jgi:hypothetical protein